MEEGKEVVGSVKNPTEVIEPVSPVSPAKKTIFKSLDPIVKLETDTKIEQGDVDRQVENLKRQGEILERFRQKMDWRINKDKMIQGLWEVKIPEKEKQDVTELKLYNTANSTKTKSITLKNGDIVDVVGIEEIQKSGDNNTLLRLNIIHKEESETGWVDFKLFNKENGQVLKGPYLRMLNEEALTKSDDYKVLDSKAIEQYYDKEVFGWPSLPTSKGGVYEENKKLDALFFIYIINKRRKIIKEDIEAERGSSGPKEIPNFI